jgi:dihydroorotase
MVELFTTGPARVLGMERKIAVGEAPDLTILSTEHEWTYNVKDSASKSRNSPFDGRSFKGAPMATIVAGRLVWKR